MFITARLLKKKGNLFQQLMIFRVFNTCTTIELNISDDISVKQMHSNIAYTKKAKRLQAGRFCPTCRRLE